MTHADIYEKFMIEYDKENVTTSYPSLTEYEIATLLDKAYLALIAQKFTGNNMRRVPFEGDEKAVEDLQPLVKTTEFVNINNIGNGLLSVSLSGAVMFVISVLFDNGYADTGNNEPSLIIGKQIQSKDLYKFIQSVGNRPWSKYAMYCIQNGKIITALPNVGNIRYNIQKCKYTYISIPIKFTDKNKPISEQSDIQFELSDSMAEELVNLALIMSTEVVESPRMQTKLELKGLES